MISSSSLRFRVVVIVVTMNVVTLEIVDTSNRFEVDYRVLYLKENTSEKIA